LCSAAGAASAPLACAAANVRDAFARTTTARGHDMLMFGFLFSSC
jgi:hypothetical protein